MPTYMRTWDCVTCQKPLYYDSDAHTQKCGCGKKHHYIPPDTLMLFLTTDAYVEIGCMPA